jgi:hypothetical protein
MFIGTAERGKVCVKSEGQYYEGGEYEKYCFLGYDIVWFYE